MDREFSGKMGKAKLVGFILVCAGLSVLLFSLVFMR
jgi:hypothetical protein